MLKKNIQVALGFGLCALLVSCGESTPDSGTSAKSKPKYEVPKSQIIAEANGQRQAAPTATTPTSISNEPVAGGIDKKGFGSSANMLKSGDSAKGPSTGTPTTTQAQSDTPKPTTPTTIKTGIQPLKKNISDSSASAASSGSTPSTNNLPPAAGLAGIADQGAVDAVSSYATGEMALSIKKRAEDKLKTIQSKHNNDLKKALEGN